MEFTQFRIDIEVKDRLDQFKAEKKEQILQKYDKKRRMVTNADAIRFMLDALEEGKEGAL